MKLSASFSVRERTDGIHDYFEWEVLTGSSYDSLWQIDVGYEREADQFWWILKSSGTKYQIGLGLDGEYDVIQQGYIDRQSLMIGKHWHGIGILAGATTQRWNAMDSEGAYTFKIPLYWGYVKYVTDFRDFRQYESKLTFPKSQGIYYIRGEWFQDEDRVYRKIKCGIQPSLTDIKKTFINVRKLVGGN